MARAELEGLKLVALHLDLTHDADRNWSRTS